MLKIDDSMGDGFVLDDAILIHSMRPERLFAQIKSFIENQIELVFKKRKAIIKNLASNKRIRNQVYIIVGDNPEADEEYYQNQIKRIKEYIKKQKLEKNIKLSYWGYDRQINFFNYLFSKFEDKNIRVLFKDYKSKKLGGLRGVQNKSIIIADYVTRNLKGNIIYHKLDDDIYSYVASFKNKKIFRIVHGYNIFDHKAKLLDKNGVRVIGSRYVIDSPSPLIDLKEGLTELNTIFEGIKKNPEDSINNWGNISKNMYCVAEYFVDESKIVQTEETPFLYKDIKVSDALKIIFNLVETLERGNNRLLFNTIENISKGFEGFRDAIMGGFVSFKKESKIIPWITGSNQDLIFTAFENAMHGGVYGDLPIGHIKSLNIRKSLIDSLIVGEKFGLATNDFLIMSLILKLGKKKGFKLSKNIPYNKSIYGWGLNFTKPNDFRFMLDNADKNLGIIIRKNIFKDNEIKKGLKNIKKFFIILKINWNKMSKSFNYDTKQEKPRLVAEELFNLWYSNINAFNELRIFTSNIKEEF